MDLLILSLLSRSYFRNPLLEVVHVFLRALEFVIDVGVDFEDSLGEAYTLALSMVDLP